MRNHQNLFCEQGFIGFQLSSYSWNHALGLRKETIAISSVISQLLGIRFCSYKISSLLKTKAIGKLQSLVLLPLLFDNKEKEKKNNNKEGEEQITEASRLPLLLVG